MRMNGREVVWSCKRGFVKASGLKERVCRSEALSVETLRRFRGAMEERRQQKQRQQSFEALYQERLGKGPRRRAETKSPRQRRPLPEKGFYQGNLRDFWTGRWTCSSKYHAPLGQQYLKFLP
jgi:hypothetical protein